MAPQPGIPGRLPQRVMMTADAGGSIEANSGGRDMKPDHTLLAGPLAAAIFGLGIGLLPLWIPGYDQIHQTVSEIGMRGSPMEIPFSIMLIAVAVCVLVFGWGLGAASLRAGHSPLAGYLAASMAVCAAGIALFPFPAAPHNYFGMLELVGYQAPLAFAIAWRRDVRAARLVRLSWLMGALMWAAIALNLGALERGGIVWAYERPFYGLVQRSLFAVFFLWCAALGAMLHTEERRRTPAGSVTLAKGL